MEGNLGKEFQDALQKQNASGNAINPLNSKIAGLAWTLLLGNEQNYNISSNLKDIPKNVDFIFFFIDPKDKDSTVSGPPIFWSGKIVVRDVETGKKISLNKYHEYAIKKIENGDIIEIVDPQNNQKSCKVKSIRP